MVEYVAESSSVLIELFPADDLQKDFTFALAPGFYTNINMFVYNSGARGQTECFIKDSVTGKVLHYFKTQYSKFGYDRLSWETNNIQIKANVVFYLRMTLIKAGDEVSWGYYATRKEV